MLFFLISCFSFILLSKSLPFKPFCGGLCLSTLTRPFFSKKLKLASKLGWPFIKKVVGLSLSSGTETADEDEGKEASLLDLPELALECILEKLSPEELCRMGQVCASMRYRCRSDRLWERHLNRKWGRLISESAHREWQCWAVSRKTENRDLSCRGERKSWRWSWACTFLRIWPFSGIMAMIGCEGKPRRSSLPIDSVMAWYLSLESGQLWFPAQVYNRENGHAGFMLSCYDAKISYDAKTDAFQARYSSHGRRTVEENIPWERLRAPPVHTLPTELHVSDCLSSLRPSDHIEIQWRKSIEFPYGWWYGVVGHLETCNRNENYCHCQQSDAVILEFNQYPRESRWRQTVINRKGHREEGNEVNGFYGGVRKLYRHTEISTWKSLWPARASQ